MTLGYNHKQLPPKNIPRKFPQLCTFQEARGTKQDYGQEGGAQEVHCESLSRCCPSASGLEAGWQGGVGSTYVHGWVDLGDCFQVKGSAGRQPHRAWQSEHAFSRSVELPSG